MCAEDSLMRNVRSLTFIYTFEHANYSFHPGETSHMLTAVNFTNVSVYTPMIDRRSECSCRLSTMIQKGKYIGAVDEVRVN